MHSVNAQGVCSCGGDCGRDGGKHPRIKSWDCRATTRVSTIRCWWTRWPNIGLALGPSRLVVIDVDPRNGGDESHHALVQRLGAYRTIRSLTGGGGTHDFFVAAPTTRIRMGTNAFGDAFPGIDVKGVGGCVVLPPSVHKNGSRYAWEAEQEGSIAELPAAWAEALAQPMKRLIAGESDELIPEGKRRQALLRLAGRLRRLGLNAPTIREVLHATNARQCSPPLDARKIEAMAADIAVRYRPAVALVAAIERTPGSSP